MKTANAMQLKARIKNRAREAKITPQAMMQNYLLERLLERLAKSKWRDNVVVKGGMLISSFVGVASRTTMDLDTTVRGFDLAHESAEAVFRQVAAVEVDDDWEFEFERTEDIREDDDYPGIRVHLKGNYAPMSVPLTVDATTGDAIVPGPVEYAYPLLFDEGSITLMSYTVETVLAEKPLGVGLFRGEGQRDAARVHHLLVERARHGGEVEPIVAGDLGRLALEVAIDAARRL